MVTSFAAESIRKPCHASDTGTLTPILPLHSSPLPPSATPAVRNSETVPIKLSRVWSRAALCGGMAAISTPHPPRAEDLKTDSHQDAPVTAPVPAPQEKGEETTLRIEGPIARTHVELDVGVPIRDFRVRARRSFAAQIAFAKGCILGCQSRGASPRTRPSPSRLLPPV